MKWGDWVLVVVAGVAAAVPIVVGEVYDLEATGIASLFEGAAALLVGLSAVWASIRVPSSIEHAGRVRGAELRAQSTTERIEASLDALRSFQDHLLAAKLHAQHNMRTALDRVQDFTDDADRRGKYEDWGNRLAVMHVGFLMNAPLPGPTPEAVRVAMSADHADIVGVAEALRGLLHEHLAEQSGAAGGRRVLP